MARTITIRRDASDLDIDDDNHGGREVMDDLLREVHPTITGRASRVVGQSGRSETSTQFFEDISGDGKGSNPYKAARRNFQRYAKTGRTPQLGTLENYQRNYEAKHGERNELIDDLIIAAGGEVPEEDEEAFGELPPGDLELEVRAEIKVTTGKKNKKQRSDVRTRAVVLDIPRSRQRQAIADPLGEWIRQLEDSIPEFDIADVDYIEARFTPKG